MAPFNLTEGAIAMLSSGDADKTELKPVLQVADIRLVITENNNERYRILLSDGVFTLQGLLATNCNHLVKSEKLRKGSILQLTQYVCNVIRNRMIIIIIDLDVIVEKCDPIGEPKQYPTNTEASFGVQSSTPDMSMRDRFVTMMNKEQANTWITPVTGLEQNRTPFQTMGTKAAPAENQESNILLSLSLPDHEEEKISNQQQVEVEVNTPLANRKRARAATAQDSCESAELLNGNREFFSSQSIFDVNDGDLCAQYLRGLATPINKQALAGQNFDEKLKLLAIHMSKATAVLSDVMGELGTNPLKELETLRNELHSVQDREKRFRLANDVLTEEIQLEKGKRISLENKAKGLEEAVKKAEEQLALMAGRCAEARAIGYDEGIARFPLTTQGQAFMKRYWEEEKVKFLKSGEFLHHLQEGAFVYFNYGYDSAMKWLSKKDAVNNMPELPGFGPQSANATTSIDLLAKLSPVQQEVVDDHPTQSPEPNGEEDHPTTALLI